MEVRFSEDGKTGYIPMGDGTCATFRDENWITFAAASPDRRSIVVCTASLIYVMDSNMENLRLISESRASSRVYPFNEGIVFLETADDGKHLVRYTFADDKSTDLGACDPVQRVDYSLAAAGVSNGELCVLAPDSDTTIHYPDVKEEIRLRGVSGDGKTVVWTEETDKFLTQRLYTLGENGAVQELGEIQARGLVYCQFSADSSLSLVLS